MNDTLICYLIAASMYLSLGALIAVCLSLSTKKFLGRKKTLKILFGWIFYVLIFKEFRLED